MKIIKKALLTLTFILFVNLSFSQQKTVYEKKVEGLKFLFFEVKS